MAERMMRMVAPFLLVTVMVAAGCSGAQRKGKPGDADPDAPSKEKLAECPCGNPEWDRLPEGSKKPEDE